MIVKYLRFPKVVYLKNILILWSSIIFTSAAVANPEGGTVTNGNATISQSGNNTTINQTSQQTIIEWNSFNIGSKETTHFQQPTNGIALNRINSSQGMTQIYGQLTATGKIILINAAGIYFGTGSVISVGGLIASTSNISNANFLAGKYIFDQPSPYNASIINDGIIRAADYGLVALIGSTVTNRGLIEAELGSVVLATGDKFTLDFYGDQLINFSVDARASQGGRITNTGAILADGGKILVTAEAAQNVLDNVIDMQGVAQANSVGQVDGQIILAATTGEIRIGGKLRASGYHGLTGGTISVSANQITLQPKAVIQANGDSRGGTITLASNSVSLGGDLSAIGEGESAVGGNITVAANTIQLTNGSKLNVSGNAGGGNVTLSGNSGLTLTKTQATYIGMDGMSVILADAMQSGNAGTINISGGTVDLSGNISAIGNGNNGVGGSIQVAANSFSAIGAQLNVSGNAGGGNISVAGSTAPVTYINIDSASAFLANAINSGSAGEIDLAAVNVNLDGNLSATGLGATSVGGKIQVAANSFVAQGALMDVSAVTTAGSVTVAGISKANAAYINIDSHSNIFANANGTNSTGGNINLYADNVSLAGALNANASGVNSTGGNIAVYGDNLTLLPMTIVTADAGAKGGTVKIGNDATQKIMLSAGSTITAKAQNVNGFGGTISLVAYNSSIGGVLDSSAVSNGASGGNINVSGNNIEIASLAQLNASGYQNGGNIVLGAPSTSLLNVDAGSSLIAMATGNNKSVGGNIQIYSQITNINGTLNTSATTAAGAGTGGVISVYAMNTINIGNTANLNSEGDSTGGMIFIGGEARGSGPNSTAEYTNVSAGSVINASSLGDGNGGSVVVWADQLSTFGGLIVAQGGARGGNGGQVEVSGKARLVYAGKTDLTGTHGATGTLTLDPQNITIQNVGASSNPNDTVITVAALETMLLTANVLLVTSSSGNAPGDITVANNVSWDNSNKLTLSAYRNVNVDATITNNAGGSLALAADDTNTGVGTINFANNASVNMSGGGSVTLSYEPANGNFRYPNTYADNVNIGNGTTVSYTPLNYVTPQDNSAIISSFNVVPNVYANMSIALWQEPIEVIPAVNGGTVLALENNLEVITASTPALGVRVNDAPAGSGCGESAACVSNDFVIE